MAFADLMIKAEDVLKDNPNEFEAHANLETTIGVVTAVCVRRRCPNSLKMVFSRRWMLNYKPISKAALARREEEALS